MTCLDEAALVRVHWNDATDAERMHAAGCPACTRALAALATDLGRIDAVLHRGVAVRRVPRALPVRIAPLAATAMLVLALLLGRPEPMPDVGDADTWTMLDELMETVAPYELAGFDLGGDDEAPARSTCAWGEPFLEMGCEEPPVTLAAWR